LRVYFGLGAADRAGTAGAWAGAGYVTETGAVSVIGTLNATFYITGVQLEKGSTATSFDYRPYGTEFALCQRYCHAFSSVPLGRARDGDTVYGPGVYMGTTMRATPTLRSGASITISAGTAGTPIIITGTGYAGSPDIVMVGGSGSSWNVGNMVALTNAVFEAEL
jgi:hypothetical protein